MGHGSWRTAGLLTVLVALWIAFAGGRAYGNAVRGELFTIKQPDGESVQVRIWGDEYYRVVESLDGYTLTPDPKTGGHMLRESFSRRE